MSPFAPFDRYQVGVLLDALECGLAIMSAVLLLGLVLYLAMTVEHTRAALHR